MRALFERLMPRMESPSEERAFDDARFAQNRARIATALALSVPTHAAHVAAFALTRPSHEDAIHRVWRATVLGAHGIMGLYAFATLALLRNTDARFDGLRRASPPVVATLYLALAAVLSGADQAVTPDVAPWLTGTLAVMLLIRLDVTPTILAQGAGYALFLVGQWIAQPDASVRLSNSVKGLSASMLGLGVSLVLGRAQRRDFAQSRVIERQRVDLERALDEARRAAQEADEANRAKSLLLATVSHEIRTPMTGVLGVTELLAQTPLDGEQRRLLDTVQESGRTLLALLNDLLDHAKAEAGRLRLDASPFAPAEAVDAVVRLFSPRARARGLTLDAAWSTTAPEALLGDALRLRQVLGNLVGNALKFTAHGGVSVRCHAAVVDDLCALSLDVTDTGAGIDDATRARLFTPYAQGEARTADAGTGLGLAISRQIVSAMGGTIEVESRPGEGSTFRVRVSFPVASAEARASARPPEPVARARRSGRALVVDDNLVNQIVLREMLRRLGLDVTVAADGLAALEATEAERFDVVLTDLQMPVLDGVSFLRALRAREGDAARLPVIVLSAGVDDDARAACLAAGAEAVLDKPITVAQVEAALAPHLRPSNESGGEVSA